MLNLLQIFRGKQTHMSEMQYHDSQLALDREDVRKHSVLIAEKEGRWEKLESRGDFGADQEREAIRAVLPGLHARRDARLRRIAAGEERERIVNTVLWPLYTQMLASLERRFERLATSPDVPDDDDWFDLCQANLEVERLRLVLYETTQLDEFRRGFDVPRLLREHWTGIHRDRERLFHLIGPGNKPKLGEPAWLADARRLSDLRVASTALKETAHAVR